jgi:hypothetical protein
MQTIVFGGKERVLKFKASAMRDFQMVEEQTLTEALPKRGHTTLAALLWCGLKHDDTRLSVSKVWDYMDDYLEAGCDINDLWDSVGEALMDSGVIGRRKATEGKAAAPAPTTA